VLGGISFGSIWFHLGGAFGPFWRIWSILEHWGELGPFWSIWGFWCILEYVCVCVCFFSCLVGCVFRRVLFLSVKFCCHSLHSTPFFVVVVLWVCGVWVCFVALVLEFVGKLVLLFGIWGLLLHLGKWERWVEEEGRKKKWVVVVIEYYGVCSLLLHVEVFMNLGFFHTQHPILFLCFLLCVWIFFFLLCFLPPPLGFQLAFLSAFFWGGGSHFCRCCFFLSIIQFCTY